MKFNLRLLAVTFAVSSAVMMCHNERSYGGGLATMMTRSLRFVESKGACNENSMEFWWQKHVCESMQRGPLVIEAAPAGIKISRKTGLVLLQMLAQLGVTPSPNKTIIDIGLPLESLQLAEAGFSTHSFEARSSAYNNVKSQVEMKNLTSLINLHHAALSNVSGGSTEIFDAADSSSLIETAVSSGPELKKFSRLGRRMETVTLNTLDSFVTSAVGMKIDTQGVEVEIFMGSKNLLSNAATAPKVIITEYCSRLRNPGEMLVGIHLLRGLGYSCHGLLLRNDAVFDESTEYCGDFACIRQPA